MTDAKLVINPEWTNRLSIFSCYRMKRMSTFGS
jgi:hypothetical protein